LTGMPWLPEKVFVEKESQGYPLTGRILDRLAGIPVSVVHSAEEAFSDIRYSRNPVREAKKRLWLARQRGSFIKPCPCTPEHVRCGYDIINVNTGCPLDCTYCILQDYLANPLVTVFVNVEDLRLEMDSYLSRKEGRVVRMGTGELGDSLALDHLTGYSLELAGMIGGRKNVYLELKTKTAGIRNIRKLDPSGNIIVSWSLNSIRAADEEEHGAPSVEDRIRAASLVSAEGFPVGFHFDPILHYPGWEEDYRAIVSRLFQAVSPRRIAWISLGSLRFPPSLKKTIRSRFPQSKASTAEFIKGRDGKCRYFSSVRIELYRKFLEWIRSSGGGAVAVYLCMESDFVWKETLEKNKGERKPREISFPLSLQRKGRACVWSR